MFCAERRPEKHFILFIYFEILHKGCPAFFWGGRLNCNSVMKKSSVSPQSEELEIYLQAFLYPKDILLFVCLKDKKDVTAEELKSSPSCRSINRPVTMCTVLFNYVLTWDVLSRKWTVLKSEVQLCNKGFVWRTKLHLTWVMCCRLAVTNCSSALPDWKLHVTEFWVVLKSGIKHWALWKMTSSSCWCTPNCHSYLTLNQCWVPRDTAQPNSLDQCSSFFFIHPGLFSTRAKTWKWNFFSTGRPSLPYFTNILQWGNFYNCEQSWISMY